MYLLCIYFVACMLENVLLVTLQWEVRGKRETLRKGKTGIFLCESETFQLVRLRLQSTVL